MTLLLQMRSPLQNVTMIAYPGYYALYTHVWVGDGVYVCNEVHNPRCDMGNKL